MNKKLYPENWEQLADRIKSEAGYKCESCKSFSIPGKILTVHHLDNNPKNNKDKNLVALCQVCHLSFQSRYLPGQRFLFKKYIPQWLEKRKTKS